MDLNTILTFVGPILTAILISIVAPYFLNFYLKKKFQKLQYMNDSYQLFQNLENNFKTNFLEPIIQENLFFIIADFRTNYKSIPAYVELKNRLGKDFDWPFIKSAKPHLRYNEQGKIYIKLSKSNVYLKNSSVGISLILCIVGFAVLLYSNYALQDTFSKFIAFYVFAAIFFCLSYIAISGVTSIINAGVLAKRLAEIESREDTTALEANPISLNISSVE